MLICGLKKVMFVSFCSEFFTTRKNFKLQSKCIVFTKTAAVAQNKEVYNYTADVSYLLGSTTTVSSANCQAFFLGFECPSCGEGGILTIVKTNCRHCICAICFHEAYGSEKKENSERKKCPVCAKNLADDFNRFDVSFMELEEDKKSIKQERYDFSLLYSLLCWRCGKVILCFFLKKIMVSFHFSFFFSSFLKPCLK